MASTVSLVALVLFASSQVAVVALAFVLGLSAFFTAPALNARISVAGAAPTLAGATTTAAFSWAARAARGSAAQ